MVFFLFVCFWERFSNFHLSLPVDPVNAAPTTSTRVFYISVGVCCAVIFLVAIILAVLHLHSMKRIELDDRYVFKLLRYFRGAHLLRSVGVLVSKWALCSSLQFLLLMSSCSSYYLCRAVVSAIQQNGSSCGFFAVYGVGGLWLLGFCWNSCVADT